MVRDWKGLCPAVDCSKLMMMMMISILCSKLLELSTKTSKISDKDIDDD
jgi:hypothetical protein